MTGTRDSCTSDVEKNGSDWILTKWSTRRQRSPTGVTPSAKREWQLIPRKVDAVKKRNVPCKLHKYFHGRDISAKRTTVQSRKDSGIMQDERESYVTDRRESHRFPRMSQESTWRCILAWDEQWHGETDRSVCQAYQAYQRNQPKEPMISQPIPDLPWQFVAVDLMEYEQESMLFW